MSHYRVIFDLDDTLYAEREFACSGFRAVGRWAADRWGTEGLAEDMIRMLDDGHLGALFKIAYDRHRPGHSEAEFAEMREVYRTHAPKIELFADAVWALEHFGRQGPLGLITDGTTAVQRAKVQGLGIAHHFDEIVFTHDGGGRAYHKPHPWSFEHMEIRLGGPDSRFVYVGDNAAKDFITPNARGWVSVQVRRERPIHDQSQVADGGEPQHVIDSLHELDEILK